MRAQVGQQLLRTLDHPPLGSLAPRRRTSSRFKMELRPSGRARATIRFCGNATGVGAGIPIGRFPIGRLGFVGCDFVKAGPDSIQVRLQGTDLAAAQDPPESVAGFLLALKIKVQGIGYADAPKADIER